MAKQGTLLVVDDNRNILTSLQYLLEEYFQQVITLNSPVTIPSLLQREAVDVVLLDMNFSSGINSGNEGLYWLREIKRLRPQIQVVLFTAYADINLAVTGLKDGATDFVVKPWDNAKLVQTLQEAYAKDPLCSGFTFTVNGYHTLYELAHQLDPQNRPVTLVCCQNDYTKDITTRTMDIVCINRYYGWYNLSGDMDAACYGLNQELDFWAEQHKPVMMSEYGADTVAGLHTAGAEMFSEEFQVEFYRRLDAEFDKRPWFVGEFVWNFADYDTVQGPMRVDGNKKGLFTRDRRPKLGMHFLRQRWAEIPTFGFKE